MNTAPGVRAIALAAAAALVAGACSALVPLTTPRFVPSTAGPTTTAGGRTDDPGASMQPASGPEEPPMAELSFVPWTDAQGFISTEVPAGWTVEGGLGPAGLTDGQFTITVRSPDGRTEIVFGHNIIVFMEAGFGPYMPGAETIERIILPDYVKRNGVQGVRVTYRSANTHLDWPTALGDIPLDTGTIGFLYVDSAARTQYGTATTQTIYMASPGTPGAWRPRLFAAAMAPADAGSQALAKQAIDRLVERLQLSDQFVELWNEGFAQTQQVVRAYSEQMSRIFHGSSSAAGAGGDSADDWASYMRGGEYATNPDTGESYWVSNDYEYNYVNSQGTVAGNNTGSAPTDDDNWTRLTTPQG